MTSNMSRDTIRRSLYRNIMIFSIVAVIVTVILLLVVLAQPNSKRFATTIITAEIGILVILVWSFIAMNAYVNGILKQIESQEFDKISVDRCPDFFTSQRDSEGNVVCHNGIRVPETGYEFNYVGRAPSRVDLNTVNNKTKRAACLVANPSVNTNPNYNIPWTSLRPRCTAGQVDAPEGDGDEEDCDTKYGFVYSENE